VTWYDTLAEIISLRSFTSVWYWLSVAALWSTITHRGLGVPYDIILRASREGCIGQAQVDLEDLVRINCNRLNFIMRSSGTLSVALTTFVVTALAVIGFYYKVEIAQAVIFILAPFTLVGATTAAYAKRISEADLSGEALIKSLGRLRYLIQLIGVAAVFATAFWGIWHNMTVSVL
jgi:hypothetical protein